MILPLGVVAAVGEASQEETGIIRGSTATWTTTQQPLPRTSSATMMMAHTKNSMTTTSLLNPLFFRTPPIMSLRSLSLRFPSTELTEAG